MESTVLKDNNKTSENAVFKKQKEVKSEADQLKNPKSDKGLSSAKKKNIDAGKRKFDKTNQTTGDHRPSVYIDVNAGKIIAITGGIATGKTFVLNCFKKLGFEIFSADQEVHNLMKKGGQAYAAIAEIFPNSIGPDGMERKKISEEIVLDPTKLQKMEAILHPLVRSAQVDFMVNVKKGSQKSVVFEVPLLFENKREKYYDYIVLTATGLELQKERAMARTSMTEEKFNLIIKKQLPVAEKIKKAHVVIKTNTSLEDTFNQVKRIVTKSDVKRDNFRHRNNRTKP